MDSAKFELDDNINLNVYIILIPLILLLMFSYVFFALQKNAPLDVQHDINEARNLMEFKAM